MRCKESAKVVLMLCLCSTFVFIVLHFFSTFVGQQTHVLYHHSAISMQTRFHFCRIQCRVIRSIGADIFKQPDSSNLRVESILFIYVPCIFIFNSHFATLFISSLLFSFIFLVNFFPSFVIYILHYFRLILSFLNMNTDRQQPPLSGVPVNGS